MQIHFIVRYSMINSKNRLFGQGSYMASNLLRTKWHQFLNKCGHGSCALPPGIIYNKINLFKKESQPEYAFEMISSTLRFGKGVTAEIGYDVQNFGSKKPLIMTDKNVINTTAFKYFIISQLI